MGMKKEKSTMTNSGVLTMTAASGVMTSGAAFAQSIPSGGYYNGHMWGDGYGWSMMGGGAMFVFWIFVIVLIVLAVRWATDRENKSGNGSTAIDILKERLARGEIEPAEYEERRKVLDK